MSLFASVVMSGSHRERAHVVTTTKAKPFAHVVMTVTKNVRMMRDIISIETKR